MKPESTPPPRPLRILQFNSRLSGGGTDDQCVKLAGALRQLGQDVWLAGPDGREFAPIIRTLQIPFADTGGEGALKLALIGRVARLIRRHRIEIVHSHHGRDIWPTILAARLSGARPKIVLTRHLAKSPASWPSRRFLLGQCDALIAVSGFVARVLREGVDEPDSPTPERRHRPPLQGNHTKIRVIHGGIDTDRFCIADGSGQRATWGVEPDAFVFAMVGGYDLPRGKGQREFLQAASQIHAQVPAARFLIVGRGNMAELLRADIQRLGLTGKAWLTPYCQDMPAAMNALDCLVHSQVGTEAFPGVVLEAFACGRPVIASALDGIPEAFAVGGVGKLVAPEKMAELAAAMREIVGAPQLTSAGRAGLHERIAADFSVRAFGLRTLDFYRELLDRRARPAGSLAETNKRA
jgi:glycosyltransferase involved in cell wall biosynthesis